ncbi:MAG: VCBS repeat-containing protein [Deltaproteobacteria bacterium]|nr:VCBS repeat-containing protein [Deltaproteobacteria bacterium]
MSRPKVLFAGPLSLSSRRGVLAMSLLALAGCSDPIQPGEDGGTGNGDVVNDLGGGNGDGATTSEDAGGIDGGSTGEDGGTSGMDGGSTGSDGAGGGGDGSSGGSDGAGGGDGGPALCTITPSPEAFRSPSLSLHWRANTPGMAFMGVDQVCSTPAVANIMLEAPDESPVPEIAFMTFDCANSYRNAVLRVISGAAPHRLLWSQTGTAMPNDATGTSILRWDGHVAVGDLDGIPSNGLEIVAVRSDVATFGLIAFYADGRRYWISSGTGTIGGANPAINIADLNADGIPEVVAGSAVFHGRTGGLLWRGTGTTGVNGQGPLSVVSNLDNDNSLEVIAGGTVYEANGTVRFSAMGDGFAAVGDVLNAANRSGHDGVAEIVRVRAGQVEILDRRTGAVRWTVAVPMTSIGGAPTIADFDGDGEAEIGVAGALRYSVIDPGCLDATGGCVSRGVRWSTVTEDSSSEVTSSTVFDFNGDGASEVVYNDEEQFFVLDGRNGRVLYQNWNPSQTRTEQAVIADVDNNGQADIIFGANTCAAFAGDKIPAALQATERVPGLEIWSGGSSIWSGARGIWNEHGYHIDNLLDDGRVPVREPASWLTHNTFRLNRSRERFLLAPDLVARPEPSNCAAGMAQVCVTVRNDGSSSARPVLVTVYDRDPAMGGMRIGAATTTGMVTPMASQRVCVSIPAPGSTRDYFVRLDDDGANAECNETNNSTTVTVTCGPG